MPGEPITAQALALAVQSVNQGDRDGAWLSTGPGLLTRAFARAVGQQADFAAFLPERILLRLCDVQQAVAIGGYAAYKVAGKRWLRIAETGRREPAAGPAGEPR